MSKKVLVVDDEQDIRTFLSAALKKAGYVAITASDGAEALKIAKQEQPALVCLDLMMPKQTGTDFYRNFVKSKDFANTPIIIVSGLSGRGLAVKKAAAVFDKPIDPAKFIEAVKSALGDE